MITPVYQPHDPGEATLSVETFDAVYTNLTLATEGEASKVLRVSDLEDKLESGRASAIIGRQLTVQEGGNAAGPGQVTLMALNEQGIALAGRSANEALPGYPIAYINFAKVYPNPNTAGDTSTLNGWMNILDNRVIGLESEWRLNPLLPGQRREFARFAGKVGIDYLFRVGGRLRETFTAPYDLSYSREGQGQRLVQALIRLRANN